MINRECAFSRRVTFPVFVTAVIAAFFLIFLIGCAADSGAASFAENQGFLSSSAEDVFFKFIVKEGLFQNTVGFGTSYW